LSSRAAARDPGLFKEGLDSGLRRNDRSRWIPAFAGMTEKDKPDDDRGNAGMTRKEQTGFLGRLGMTERSEKDS